ncbi:MAG TPA: hypothetical protein DCZ94_22695 [Lentisphaeria bacterium]|nr:hypothetical protein [Lentisphaeria bacterium]
MPVEEPIDYSDPGKYALKALTDAVNKLKEECRRTGRPLVVWDPEKKKVVEKYYRKSKNHKDR